MDVGVDDVVKGSSISCFALLHKLGWESDLIDWDAAVRSLRTRWLIGLLREARIGSEFSFNYSGALAFKDF